MGGNTYRERGQLDAESGGITRVCWLDSADAWTRAEISWSAELSAGAPPPAVQTIFEEPVMTSTIAVAHRGRNERRDKCVRSVTRERSVNHEVNDLSLIHI